MSTIPTVEQVSGTEYLIDVNRNLDAVHAGRGTSDIVLIPQPTTCTGDPLLWSKWKKYYQLFLVAQVTILTLEYIWRHVNSDLTLNNSLYACAFSFGENTLGAAWSTVSDDTGVTLTNMNGGSALNYLLLGFVNIFWIPAAKKLGRRFVFLITTVICMCAAIWLGRFKGTAQWMLAMCLNGIGTSAYQAVIQLAIFDMFFVHDRGRMLAVYLFGQQLGSILGLISGGAIAAGPGWRWSQYIVAIIEAGVFLLFLLTFEETMFPRFLFPNARPETIGAVRENKGQAEKITDKARELGSEHGGQLSAIESETNSDFPTAFPKRTYRQTLTLWVYQPQDRTTYWQYFRRPFILWTFPTAVIPGFMFALGCTAGIVSFNTISEILSSDPYSFSTTTVGLICFATLIGSIIGYFTGLSSDHLVIYLARRNRGLKEPEMRLWALGLSFVYAAVGYMLYGWGAQNQLPWYVIAIGLGGMIAHQVSVCTIATAYAMECFPGLAGELVVILAMCSSMINFAFSYSVQPFINAVGYGYTFLFFGLMVLLSMAMAVPLIMYGKRWRTKAMPKYRECLQNVVLLGTEM